MVRRLLVGVSFMAIFASTEPIVSADGNDVVRLTITTRNDKGHVFCGLHYNADKFPGRGEDNANTPIVGTTATCEFRGVKPGMVAISAYHDENDNKKFDKGMFGIPTEGYCTSRNAKGQMGPPKFDDAKFTYKGGPLELAAKMIY
jgi:uncharacterized protein (DUF2141 family)